MQKTMTQLVTDTQKLLHQASGLSVQVYSQDALMQLIQHAFDHCFTTEFWPSFLRREVKTLNGIDGKVTVPFTLIKEFKDIKSVFRKNSHHPIPEMPQSFNLLDLPSSGVVKFIEGRTDNYLFTAYPLNAKDQIVVVGRERPASEYILTDTVPFDHLALIYFAAWSYLVDDASNAGAAMKYQGLFNTRMKELQDSEFKGIVPLNPHRAHIPSTWNER